MRAKSYFVAVVSTEDRACPHEHPRLAEAFDCARGQGPEFDEVWRVQVRSAGKVPLARSKVKHRKRATRRTV